MKLIITIISNDDSNNVTKELYKSKFFCTRLSSFGGFLKKENSTLLIGAEDEDVEKVLDIISKYSKTRQEIVPNTVVNEFGQYYCPLEVKVGGGTVFVVDVEKFLKL